MGCTANAAIDSVYTGVETSLHNRCCQDVDVVGSAFNPYGVSVLHTRDLLLPRVSEPLLNYVFRVPSLEPKFVDFSTLDDKLPAVKFMKYRSPLLIPEIANQLFDKRQ
jgi:hypothetical protein